MDPIGFLVGAVAFLFNGGVFLVVTHFKRVEPGDRIEAERKRMAHFFGRLFVRLGLLCLVLYGLVMLAVVIF
jgi:hypothetical protein